MRWSMLALALAALAGCSKASDATDARRMPKPPPIASAQLPAAMQIAVDVDGRPAPPIDAHRLSSTAPDFKDAERRAWKLTALVGAAAQATGVEIAAAGEDGVAVVFPQPASPTDPQPVLMENRRGEIIATLLSPSAPFPDFHREGGRLHRPGDPTPHVARVTAIHVRTRSPSGGAK